MSTDIREFREAHGSDQYAGLLCDVGADLECAICQSIMFVPFVLDCGHNYCYPCLKQWFVDNNSCPQCRTKICKAPTHSLTLTTLADSITNKMVGVDPSLEKQFAKRKKEQVKPYTKDVAKKRVFPAFNAGSTHHLDEEDGVQRCSQCHWELEEEEDRCNNCGVWVNDGHGREAAESINVDDDEDEESDSRRPGEAVSDYEDDGFVVDDEEASDGGDIDGDVTILSDSQASSPAPVSTVQIDDSDLDSEDEQFLPKTKRQSEITIDDDSDDNERPPSRRKHAILTDSDDDQPAVSRPKKSRKVFSDDEEEDQPSSSKKNGKAIFTDSEDEEEEEEIIPKRSRLKKKRREAIVVLSDEEEEESSEDDSEDDSDTDNEGITNGVYTGLPSRRRRGSDEEDDENSDDESEDEDLGGFVVDEAENDGSDDEAEYSEEY